MLVTNYRYRDFKLMSAASAKHRKREATNDAEFLLNFGRIVTCRGAEPSRTFRRILRPNFGVRRTSAFAELMN